MSKIELKNIDKFFGSNHVLKDLNLVIEDGDFMTLLGPSGCGKTTTLRVIAGLEKPQNGSMFIDGKKMIDVDEAYYEPPGNRGLNLVFQSYALWPHMTVYENVAFGLKIKKFPRDTIKKKVIESLEIMRIGELDKRYPSELSGGQQQRVAIARSIATDPKVLLLDEPLSNLDAKLRIDMRSELKRMHLEMGTTIVYVTHDQVEALTMSTKIALFKEGQLSQVATPMELYTNPIDLQAADFIGNPRINFLDGTAKLKNGTLTASCVLGKFDFPCEDLTDEEIPGNVEFPCVFGFRPEQVKLSDKKEDDYTEGFVYVSQPAGSETITSIRCKDKEFIVKELGIIEYAINDAIYFRIKPNRFNIYDTKSTRLIKRAKK